MALKYPQLSTQVWYVMYILNFVDVIILVSVYASMHQIGSEQDHDCLPWIKMIAKC